MSTLSFTYLRTYLLTYNPIGSLSSWISSNPPIVRHVIKGLTMRFSAVLTDQAKDIRRRGRDSGNALEAGGLTTARAREF